MIQIRNARILTPFSRQDGVVVVQGNKIVDVLSNVDAPRGSDVIDAKGMYLVPGYVDLHVHGDGKHSVMDFGPDAIAKLCASHAAHGTTTVLPTTLRAGKEAVLAAIDNVRLATAKTQSATIAGINIQGQFDAGSQGVQAGVPLSMEQFTGLLDRWDGIRIVGAAPELPGAFALGDALGARGIVATIAHSHATYEQILSAVSHGYSDITNLYSDGSSLVRVNGFQVPGITESGLVMDELTVQVVADGWQLPIMLLQLIFRCKGGENITLISDAGGTHSPSSRFEHGFATMGLAVKNMVTAGVPLRVALRMATVNPARRIGLEGEKGRVSAGYDADIILLDDGLNVRFSMAMGRVIRNDIDNP